MPESTELAKARELLGKFEAVIHKPDATAHLSEALLLLAEVRDTESEAAARVATNVALAYARKVQSEVELLLSREPAIHWDVIDHWQNIFAAFELAGFALPEGAAAVRSKLVFQKVQRDIRQMSEAERQELIRQLQAMDK